MIKTRFCPSPTGHLHLGNIRTALFNALLAKKSDGCFLLRIEDTDQTRSTAEYAELLQDDLHWLGLPWQEGPKMDQGAGPYLQSQRQSIYDEYYQTLQEQGAVYPCFCSDDQLALNRKVQRASGQPPRYPGTCRNLTADDIKAKCESGLKPTLRFQVPLGIAIEFDDLVRGKQHFVSDDIGDFIIRRADGTASFMYCNALDDALMGVTHALRGEDHLTNTPRQLLILQALKLPAPQYGHIALILGRDGTPLSKRNGSRSVRQLIEEGFLPEAVVNYLSRLGHHYPQADFMSFAELADAFLSSSLGRAPARFDEAQLQHWQKEAVMHLSTDVLWAWFDEATKTLVTPEKKTEFVDAIRPNILMPNDALVWARAFFIEHLQYDQAARAIFKEAGVAFFELALQTIGQSGIDFKKLCNELKQTCQVKGKALFQPLRVALTGEMHGPEMPHVLALLGPTKVRQRFEDALFTI